MKSSKLFRWKNFRNHVTETCKINYAWDRFTDMTFIVQKKRVTAHKIILSANSEFFKMILNETPLCVHPTITLPDVNYEDLDAIMQFIYTGQLLVQQDRLESVLSLASCLQVKSLMKVQAALTKQNKSVTGKVCHVQDISASSSQSEPELETINILTSGSQSQSKLETLDILASISQCQPKLEISNVPASSSKSQQTLDISDVLASSSQSEPVLEITDVMASSSQSEPMLEISDVMASSSQSEPMLEISDVMASSSQSEPMLEISDVLPSSSQSHPTMETSDVMASSSKSHLKLSPENEGRDLNNEITQRKKKYKGYFKKLVGNEKVGQSSSTTAPGELKKKGKKPGASKSEMLVVGGKSNSRGLSPKPGIAPRSSHKSIKESLLREFEKGGTIKEVSKLFNISPSCAFYYKKCFVKAGKLSPSMINYQKKSLYKNTRNKKVAEKVRAIDCRSSQPMVTAT